jgi:hypothetical protein
MSIQCEAETFGVSIIRYPDELRRGKIRELAHDHTNSLAGDLIDH